MNEAWFPAHIAPFFSFFSLLSVIAALQMFVQRGLYRRWVTAIYLAATVTGLALIVIAGIAFTLHQPGYVLFALGFPGAIVFLTCGFGTLMLPRRYSSAEMRRSVADDL